MYKTPPQEDEGQPIQTQGSYRQWRRNVAVSKRQPKDFYSDEHPEIPKVRRASLSPDTPPSLPAATSRLPRSRRPLEEEMDEEAEEIEETPSIPPTTNKIMVTQRRRPAVYEPPSNTSRHAALRQKRKRPSTRQSMLQGMGRYRRLALITLITLLCTLIVFSFVFNSLHSNQSAFYLGGNTTQPGTSQTTSQSTLDPHALVIVPPNSDHPAPPVFATSAYLLDADTGATLYAHNPFMHLPMLSTTKLMTALLAVEHGNPDQQITITDAISRDINALSADSSLMGVKKGETYTLRDLLYGMFLVSGNDAAVVVADAIGGNLPNFVNQMNQRAKQLGLNDTHYMNPHGLLMTDHFSSAHDLAILGKVSLSNPIIHQISGTKQYHIVKSAGHPDHYLINGNQFLWWYPGVDSGKPGWDGDKNFIQVVSVTRNNHHLIGVTMHTNDWWTDMRDLMNWGFDMFNWTSPHDADLLAPIPYDYDWNYFVRDQKQNTVPTADGGRYYIYTGYSVSGLILAYFDKNTGLKKFGFPLGLPKVATNTTIAQPFEHGTIQCDLSTKQCQVV